ncbi:MAG: glycosyltransferase [Bacteroidota bacterium]|nr:glycosyltransferase [Bacteroidota bacterium]
MKTILFVFTKHFPFGSAEQYLVDELPYLSSAFDKVVFVPAEIFDSSSLVQRPILSNCEILLLNEEGSKSPVRKAWGEIISVFIGEWLRCRSKSWFWKEKKRYASVLLHQSHLATVLGNFLRERYAGFQPSFYAYWIHNSSIMLGLMKRRGDIDGFVCRGHSIDLYEWDWVLTRYVKILPFYHFIIRKATHIFSISKHGADYLKKRFAGMSGKFSFSRLGVADLGINPFHADLKFTIVSCSNFSDNKRVTSIAGAISKMKTPARWIHFGDGPGKEKTEEAIRHFPSHCTAELRGYTANEKIKEFYRMETVNLFVNLSEAEGIPVSLMEAISFGIPVMATDVYGNPEVANEQTGFTLAFDSTNESIAGIIDDFAGDHVRQQQVRSSARNFYSLHFNAQKNYQEFAADLVKQH